MSDPADLTAVEAAEAIEGGQLTAERLMQACLERTRAREPEVGAWTHLDEAAALTAARACDAGPRRGLLHGLPLGIKDIFDTVDMPTAYGSPIYAGHRPAWDCPAVTLARSAGAVIAGKTVTTEFAFFHPGKTRNPHNPAHTPGGSSSGSAAAVAAGMVPLAYGSQTVGSVIRPASFCGVVGFKPSWGLISMVAVKAFAPSLDTCGLFSRSVADAALIAEVLSGRPLRSGLGQDFVPRIALCRTPQWPEASPDTVAALENGAAALRRAGAEVRELDLPDAFDGLADAQRAVMGFECARSFSYERAAHGPQLSQVLRELIDDGARVTAADYEAARRLTRHCRHSLRQVLEGTDVILAPSAPGEAPEGLQATGDPAFNRIWTLLGVPCVTLPGHRGARGLPVGLQVIGRPLDDARTLAAAEWMETRIV